MSMKYTVIVVCLSVMLVSGCKIRPWSMAHAPEDATPEFKQGWEDGCESGLAAYGNDVYKAQYSFKQDISMVSNRHYFRAWSDAYNYCRAYINRFLGDGFFGGGGFDQGSNLRNRRIVRGSGLNFGESFTRGTWSEGIPGFNNNFFSDSGDWLGREGGDTDWLGRTKEYQ